MITLITNHKLAEDSDDHIHPDGIYHDNNFNLQFSTEIENYFKRSINVLDLGCAGGEFVVKMLEKGHLAVGLEGSDHCLHIDQATVQKMGFMPKGHLNWQSYGNRNLFTCDITYDYELRIDDHLLEFDLITCFDVMEHFYEERIDKFCEMVCKHLKPDGIFLASIAMFPLEKDDVVWHKSLFDTTKWSQILSKHFRTIKNPFTYTYRPYHPRDTLIFSGTKL